MSGGVPALGSAEKAVDGSFLVDFSNEMSKLTLYVLSGAGFGKRISWDEPDFIVADIIWDSKNQC